MRELVLFLTVAVLNIAPPREGFKAPGFAVSSGKTVVARVWPRADALQLKGLKEPRTRYATITRGEPLALVTLLQPWQDFRAQTVPPGTYVLRYAVQPLLKDHAGTSPWRDFGILTGTQQSRHPYVVALVAPEDATFVLDLKGVRVGVQFEGTGELGF